MSKWYIKFPDDRQWYLANKHQQNAVKKLIALGEQARIINVDHMNKGVFSAMFDKIERQGDDLLTAYTPVHAGWETHEIPPEPGLPPIVIDVDGRELRAIGQILYVNRQLGLSQWEFPPAKKKVEMKFTFVGRFTELWDEAHGGGGNLNYRKNKISINLHNRSRSNRYRSHRYRKNKHIINLYKRARKGTRRLS